MTFFISTLLSKCNTHFAKKLHAQAHILFLHTYEKNQHCLQDDKKKKEKKKGEEKEYGWDSVISQAGR